MGVSLPNPKRNKPDGKMGLNPLVGWSAVRGIGWLGSDCRRRHRKAHTPDRRRLMCNLCSTAIPLEGSRRRQKVAAVSSACFLALSKEMKHIPVACSPQGKQE